MQLATITVRLRVALRIRLELLVQCSRMHTMQQIGDHGLQAGKRFDKHRLQKQETRKERADRPTIASHALKML